MSLEREKGIVVRPVPKVYPKKYVITNRISIIRFAALGYLLFTEWWWVALLCAAVKYLISMVCPTNDSRNLKILLFEIILETDSVYHEIRKKAGEVLAKIDGEKIYLNIGRIISISVCDQTVCGEVVYEKNGELMVVFEKAISINNSSIRQRHRVSEGQLAALTSGSIKVDFSPQKKDDEIEHIETRHWIITEVFKIAKAARILQNYLSESSENRYLLDLRLGKDWEIIDKEEPDSVKLIYDTGHFGLREIYLHYLGDGNLADEITSLAKKYDLSPPRPFSKDNIRK